MEIVFFSDDKLKISLSQKDAAELGLVCEGIDYTNSETKGIFLSLLEKAKTETGFSPKGSKLFVEAYSDGSGGCTLYFTSVKRPARIAGNGSAIPPAVFEFQSADALIDGASKAFERYGHRIYKSSLYLLRGKYRLLVYSLDYSDKLSVSFLSEYGCNLGEDEILAAYTEEHGKELISDTAIDAIAKYFG